MRAIGRTACGVRGVRLDKQRVISLIIGDEGDVMTVTERFRQAHGRSGSSRSKGRGGMGVISIKTSGNGEQVGAVRVSEVDGSC